MFNRKHGGDGTIVLLSSLLLPWDAVEIAAVSVSPAWQNVAEASSKIEAIMRMQKPERGIRTADA